MSVKRVCSYQVRAELERTNKLLQPEGDAKKMARYRWQSAGMGFKFKSAVGKMMKRNGSKDRCVSITRTDRRFLPARESEEEMYSEGALSSRPPVVGS
eukprot:8729686-Pyramimonas_sp.AAC.1